MQLRFLKGNWKFGNFKLQYRNDIPLAQGGTAQTDWTDVPISEEENPSTCGSAFMPKHAVVEEETECKHEWVTCYEDSVPFCRHCTIRQPKSPVKEERKEWWQCPKCVTARSTAYCQDDGTPRPVEKSLEEKILKYLNNRKVDYKITYNPGEKPVRFEWELAQIAESHFRSAK